MRPRVGVGASAAGQAGPKGAGLLPRLGQRREQAVRARGPEGRSWARLGCCVGWAKGRGERAVQWIKREGMAWLGWCFVLGQKAFLFHSPISCPFLFLYFYPTLCHGLTTHVH